MALNSFSDFINQLSLMQPHASCMVEKQLPEEYINTTLNSYIVKRRNYNSSYQHPFIKFIEEYTLTNFSIAGIQFNHKVKERKTDYLIGGYDANELILDKNDNKIKWKEVYKTHILEECAKNYMCFLNALLEVQKNITEAIIDEQLEGDQSHRCRSAYICSLKAGGEEYENFYCNVLGCWK